MKPEGSLLLHKSPPPVPVLSQINPIHVPHPHYHLLQNNLFTTGLLTIGLRPAQGSEVFERPVCKNVFSAHVQSVRAFISHL